MKPKVLAFVVLVLTICPASKPGFAEKCGGKNHREHERGSYKFKTSSWVRIGDNGHYYRTCVENISNRDFWFDWFVPGPTTYVPPGESVTSPRYFQDRRSVDLLGCLQYGNHREPMQEYFIGHENDREQIEREKKEGCDVSRHDYYAATTPVELNEISYSAKIFVPSDSTNLRNTLMRINLSVGLWKKDEKSLKSSVSYSITGVHKDFSGDPKQIHVRTNSPTLREAFQRAGFKDARVGLTGFEGDLTFDVPLQGRYAFTNARYGFFDKNNVFVGAIFVPIFSPVER